jgi:hypothetical protein
MIPLQLAFALVLASFGCYYLWDFYLELWQLHIPLQQWQVKNPVSVLIQILNGRRISLGAPPIHRHVGWETCLYIER